MINKSSQERPLKYWQTDKLILKKMYNYWWKRKMVNFQFDPKGLDHGFNYNLQLPADYPQKKHSSSLSDHLPEIAP